MGLGRAKESEWVFGTCGLGYLGTSPVYSTYDLIRFQRSVEVEDRRKK